jgi:hypothetical protein
LENERCLTTEALGTGGDITIEIHSDSVETGTHKLEVIARSVCHQTRMTSAVMVEKEVAQLSIQAVSVCQGESATLMAGSDAGLLTCYWFANETGADTLARGASWTTPPLLKSQTYYVSATLTSGCTTMRLPVAVNIKNFDPALITLKDSDTLTSNYVSGNRWLLSDTLVSTEKELMADQTGTYVLIIDTLGCVSYDTIEFAYPSADYADLNDVNIYPNPVKDYLTFPPFGHSAELDIMESSGKACIGFQRVPMRPREGLRIDITCLSAGMYFAVIHVGQRKRIIKFIKAE